jgi:multiple antibiotic resistance protein
MAFADSIFFFLYVFASFFTIVNPIQATLTFVALTTGITSEERKSMAFRTTAIAFIIALLFAIGGNLILQFFGITVDSLRVAGGILLFLVAIDMLKGEREQKKVTDAELRDATYREDISVFPLATPLLTGPGAITTVIVQMGDAMNILEKVLVLGALVLTFAATYLILRSAEYVDRVLGVTGIMVMTRIQGLILGAISVTFVATGVWNIFIYLKGTIP